MSNMSELAIDEHNSRQDMVGAICDLRKVLAQYIKKFGGSRTISIVKTNLDDSQLWLEHGQDLN